MEAKLEPPVDANFKSGTRPTFLPMEFWSQIVQTMDLKSRSISEVYGYGKITMTFVVFNGKVKDVVFNDEVRVRPDWEKPPLSSP
jgi:hypothetical protein